MEPLAPEDLVDDWSDLSASSLGVGAQLGRYELLLPIAYGGMARVWAARHRGQRGFSKLVAIKTILPHLAHNPEFERMFLDEARIASGVHHPNVTEIYELGEEGQVLYLAMEWVNGESLVHVVRGIHGKTPVALDPRIAARIAADACAGLHAAHELCDEAGVRLNVVHRDVSPHNILVSQDGTVKVTDFGVARAMGQSHQATVAGQIKGKIAYMAPEVVSGAGFDRRSDLFAMGCVLYEAATGALPFRGGNDPQVMQAVLKGTYEPPPTVVRGFPLELAGVIDRALAGDPRRRFGTAEQMRIALEEWLARSGPLVTPSDVGRVVRERVGAHLDQRRDHVRSAMASAGDGEGSGGGAMRPGAGHTPSALRKGISASGASQSHSGVVPTAPDTMRDFATPGRMVASRGAPGAAAMLPPPPPAAGAPASGVAAPTLPLPIVRMPERPAASNGRYLLAALAGVGIAMLIGVAGLAAWTYGRGRAESAGIPAPPAAVVVAPARPAVEPKASPPGVLAPSPVVATAASSVAASPSPSASASARPSASPPTLNVNDLPTARPWWANVPGPGGGGAAPPAPSKGPALPANPY
ncbi:MAG TPA: serine/threonine-protein kinase [Polyangiaceae bacterium]|jgi:serine/threonine-protein kinase